MKQLLGIALVMVLTVGAMAAGAGIYKWAISDATEQNPQADIAESPTPTPSNTAQLNRNLIEGLFNEYIKDESNPGRDCLSFPSGLLKSLHPLDTNPRITVDYIRATDRWAARAAGGRCQGLEAWIIDDSTGAIEYFGTQ